MKEPKVCVIGLGGQSAFLSVEHFPAPGETVSGSDLFFELGGKGYNQAVACARMGVKTTFIGAVGFDDHGDACRRALEAEGITACLIRKEAPTAFACITTDSSGENMVQVYPGAAKELMPEDLRLGCVMKELESCDYLLLQNELSPSCLTEACAIGKELGLRVIVNPAPAENIPFDTLQDSCLMTPNYGEAKLLAGFAQQDQPNAQALVDALRAKGIHRGVITLGKDGALIIGEEGWEIVPAYSCAAPVDTTGAGDTFNGVLAACLAMGKDLAEAVRMGAVAAGIGVTRHGAVAGIPRVEEVLAAYKLVYTDSE